MTSSVATLGRPPMRPRARMAARALAGADDDELAEKGCQGGEDVGKTSQPPGWCAERDFACRGDLDGRNGLRMAAEPAILP